MTSTDLIAGVRDFRVVFIDHNHMAPDIRRDSVAFLHEPGYRGEGIYSFGNAGLHPMDLRRVTSRGGPEYLLSMDNWPGEPTRMSREDLKRCEPCMVAGVANPLTGEFIDFLRFRFREVVL